MYVVAGVSGNTGAVVADSLLRAGKRVRALVRDPAKGAPWSARGADVAVASLYDEDAVARALEGAEGAYLLSPQDMRSPDPITDGWRVADALARALERTPVPHVVALSSMGAQHAEGIGILRTMHAVEERLAATPGKVTFLRAGYFFENWAPVLGAAAAGKLPTFVEPDRALPMIATRDVGAAAARALLEGPPAARRDVVEVAGPRDYSPRDIAAVLAQLLGKPVAPEHVPLEALVPVFTGLGFSGGFAEQVRLLYQGIDAGRTAAGSPGSRLVRGSTDAEAALRSFLPAGPRS